MVKSVAKSEVLNALKLQMKQAARSLDFERAAMLRDRIKKIHAV